MSSLGFTVTPERLLARAGLCPATTPRGVRLSVFSILDAFPPDVDFAGRNRYAELLSLADAADRSGLNAVWVAEHHFLPTGLCPAPAVLLSAIGARTRRIRLGSLVSVLPFHSPIEVAEQFALLDQLIGGRLNFGVGSGYIAAELEGFGIDPAEKRARFDRSLETILAAFRGEEVRGEAPTARPVRLNVRPRQQPSPPIWIAAQRREAIPFVARRGFSLALIPYATVRDREELADEIREFRAALPAGQTATVSAAVHLYAGPAPDRARAAFQRYLDSRLATHSTFYEQKAQADPRLASADGLEESGLALIGSLNEVTEGIEAFGRAGVDELLGIFDFGGLSLSDAIGSVRRLAIRVH
jgi:alkanesulfonate monooxygenase SsuD/methylene tetrahydromethanopterin reductase-like flavin-dependent oxidoreductase (luciferase family)